MLYHLLFLKAARQIAITVDNNKPINSSTPFSSYSDWVLYQTINVYMQSYQSDKRFLDTIAVIKSYFEQKPIDSQKSTLLLEIKALLVINILYTFKLGEFNMAMLEFESNFDNALVYHYDTVSSYTLDQIESSIKMRIINYDWATYYINRSFSYIVQAYANLFYEVAKFQMDRDTNFWRDQYKFRSCLRKYIKNIDLIVLQRLLNQTDDNLVINISSSDFFTKEFDHNTLMGWIDNYGDRVIHITISLSILDLIDAFILYETVFNTDDYVLLCSRLEENVKNNKNMISLVSFARQNVRRMTIELHKSTISDYELFFVANMEVITNLGFSRFKTYYLVLRRRQNVLMKCLNGILALLRS